MVSLSLPAARSQRLPALGPPGRRAGAWLAVATVVVALGTGAAITLGPLTALGCLLILIVATCVWKWPVLGAYLVIGLTPVTTGLSIPALPLIRPNEAVDLLVAAVLAARGITRLRTGQLPRLRVSRVELSLVLLAVTNSLVPLLWMSVRQEPISQDDLLYSLVMWKLLAIYLIVRAAVRTDQQVRRCLWLSVATAAVVALIEILQSLDLFGAQGLLAHFYGQFGTSSQGPGGRGSSTTGLPAATADIMIFNLAIVSGLWIRFRRHRLVLAAAAALFLAGALAAGEFSSTIGLAVGLACIVLVTRSRRLLALFVPGLAVGGYLAWPVIGQRLLGFQSASGLPLSWTGRLYNLRTYFWPRLFTDWNFLLGVRPAARVQVSSLAAGFVWIESGYTWLLWGGGIPLLASFVFFCWVTAKSGWLAARDGPGGRGVAGIAIFTAVIVVAVLMTFDPHLTYRGSADALFGLIALARPLDSRRYAAARGHPAPISSITEVRRDSG